MLGRGRSEPSSQPILLETYRFRDDRNTVKVVIPTCTPFKTEGRQLWSRNTVTLNYFFAGFVLSAIPYAVVGALTHFHAGNSTKAQKVLTMGWLALGSVWAGLFPRKLNQSILSSRRTWEIIIIVFFCGFAIGGFVVVGQMLKDYGSCTALS
jgi:hypothetical protein